MINRNLTSSTVLRLLIICIVIIVLNFTPAQLSGPFIIITGFLIMILSKIQQSYFKLILPLVLIVITGLAGAHNHEYWNIFRDISYALSPITIIYLGYWVALDKQIMPMFLKLFMILGVILACYHLSEFILNPALIYEDSMTIRSIAGNSKSSDLIILSAILYLLQHQLRIRNFIPKFLPRFVALPILATSVVLSFSRTELLIGFILFSSLLDLFTRINPRMIVSVAIVIIIYISLALILPKSEDGTFQSKIFRSAEEINIEDSYDNIDINNNWRGFEANRALETYKSGNSFEYLFGQGFGTLVDLNINIALGGEGETTFSEVPIIHNGYMYILIKTGGVGLACYIFFYLKIILLSIRYKNTHNHLHDFMGRLLLGCILSLASIMYVVGGIAEMHGLELALLSGFLFKQLKQAKTQQLSAINIGKNNDQ